MALKRLPNDVQSLLCASAQVNNFKSAVEELVFNSLDAKSTSIAVRIDISENTIQIIDNGNGITKHDFTAIGQRYMTSKLVDISTLKAVPKNYGYRGEFLANIITVSQMVKITSRHKTTEETWAKTFNNGKEQKFAKMSTRPTNGTTVDIKGFLYNLNLQKRQIDPMNEMQNIKSFLEQLSLVHSNVSLSLRDDSKNDIIFKIHKKRDIYQTLATLFGIDSTDVVELQVEKNDYKVKGLIKKTDKHFNMHWIYLNGKFINGSSKLHKMVNEYFMKSLLIRDQRKLKSKKNNDEHELFNQNIPFYFIFLTCPYIDYNISFTTSSVLEFKNWDQLKHLLEKLVKFYVGDINLKELKKSEIKSMHKERTNVKNDEDTRDQVKKIMDKILGSNSKKLGVSQLQNGVKGKMIKRKIRKKVVRKSSLPLLCQNNENNKFSHKINIQPFFENNVEKSMKPLDINIGQHKKPQISKYPHNEIKVPHSKQQQLNSKPTPKKKTKEIKANVLSPTRRKHKTLINQKHNHRQDKFKNRDVKNKPLKIFNHLKETDSVYKRSRIVAQRAEAFLLQTKKAKANIYPVQSTYRKNKIIMNEFLGEYYNYTKDNNVLRSPNINNELIKKFIMNKIKTKSYKTTYDLIQTIQVSQQEINAEKKLPEPFYKEINDYSYTQKKSSLCISSKDKKITSSDKKYSFSEYSDFLGKQIVSQYADSSLINYKTYEREDNFSEHSTGYKAISDVMPNFSEATKFIEKHNINSQNFKFNCKKPSHHAIKGLKLLTYNSHQCHTHEVFERKDSTNKGNSYTVHKRQNVRFITKQFRDNFGKYHDLVPEFKRSSKSIVNKQSNIFNKCMTKNTDEPSYTIDYFKSNENYYNITQRDIEDSNFSCRQNDFFEHKTVMNYGNQILTNELNSVFGNTYTLQHFDISSSPKNDTKKQTKVQSREMFDTYSIPYPNSEINSAIISETLTDGEYSRIGENFNVVFVSKPQCEIESTLHNNNIEPLDVCETILHESGTIGREFALSFSENNRLEDSLYDNFSDIYGTKERIKKGPLQMTSHLGNEDVIENVSHHFSISAKKHANVVDNNTSNTNTLQQSIPIKRSDNKNICRPAELPYVHTEGNVNTGPIDCNVEVNKFNLKNRLRFVPKGMSQIFLNCYSKTACDYNLDIDYYKDSIYSNFANDVQVNAEIYEPAIQNVEDLTTKNINIFQSKVKKDHAALVFDAKSLKETKVLGQVDCKFIAAIMKTKSGKTDEYTEYLILFDQHAVHERIRLEKNLKDYIYEDKWTSVPLDNIVLKMSKDEILYLHNYKDKFSQLGLQWTILNVTEVTVHSIPEAILGKNPREVEKVIKAVKNLIVEEINVIKLQKGCVSLYPKSIMDLVFSEACRYAIKFGDQLSKNHCVELLNALSDCKTPFQCAHGRPVMAVITDIKYNKRDYKVNMAKLNRFKTRT